MLKSKLTKIKQKDYYKIDSMKKISSNIDTKWKTELDRSLKKIKGLSPYSEARHEYKSDVKHKCELCRRSVLKDIDFLCSDECANKYWKVKKKREI